MQSRLFLSLLIFFAALPSNAQVVMDRVLVDPEGDENRNDISEIIEILNLSTEARDLKGWILLSTSPADSMDAWTFPEDARIGSKQRLTVYWHTPKPAIRPANTFYTGKDGTTLLNNDGGDLALVSSEGIQHYVQWAKAGQGLEVLAVASGKWPEEDVVLRPGEGQWLQYDGDGFTAADWAISEGSVPTVADRVPWGMVKKAKIED